LRFLANNKLESQLTNDSAIPIAKTTKSISDPTKVGTTREAKNTMPILDNVSASNLICGSVSINFTISEFV